MNNALSKKHHYVPECYLKAFGNSQKLFWKRRKDVAKASICSTGQVGYEIDSNRMRTEEYLMFNNITDSLHIENVAFRKQENNYAKTLRQITKFSLSPLIIDKEKYRLFIETLVCIKRRNPSTRSLLLEAFREGYKSPTIVEDFKKHISKVAEFIDGDIDIDKYLSDFLKTKALDPNRLHDMYLNGFLQNEDSAVIETMTNDLYELDQFILHCPLSSEFITSDNPGFVVNESKLLASTGGFGGNFEFYFPLTPNTCLYVNSEKKSPKNIIEKTAYPKIVDIKQVFEINQCTKYISNSRLFGKTKAFLEKI